MSKESIYKRFTPDVHAHTAQGDSGYWFVFCSGRLLTVADGLGIPYCPGLDELKLSPVLTEYLGTLQGHPCYCVEVPPDTAAPAGMSFKDLRSSYGVLDEDIFLLAGKAIQIVTWDRTHQYCGRCGQKTQPVPGERAKRCPACGLVNYPRISPAAITAVLKGDKILLSHNAGFRGNVHSLVAGFVEPGETLEECIRREVFEEVGIRVKNIKYFSSQPWPFPNSLMIGFTAEWESGEIAVDGKEISEAAWYDAGNLPGIAPKDEHRQGDHRLVRSEPFGRGVSRKWRSWCRVG